MPDTESSVIRHVSYDDASRVLTVLFVSGRSYAYAGVPAPLYRALLDAPSKGAFFNEAIRDAFPTTEVTAPRGRER